MTSEIHSSFLNAFYLFLHQCLNHPLCALHTASTRDQAVDQTPVLLELTQKRKIQDEANMSTAVNLGKEKMLQKELKLTNHE